MRAIFSCDAPYYYEVNVMVRMVLLCCLRTGLQ